MHPTSGSTAEKQALDFLQRQGLRHRCSNFRCRIGEIDLIMEDGEHVIFVEVRLRRHTGYGGAAASVTPGKQRKLLQAAAIYVQAERLGHRTMRFDIVAFDGDATEPEWLQDAFRIDF